MPAPPHPSGFVSGIDRLLLDFSARAVAAARNSTVPWEHGGHCVTAIVLAAAAVEAHVGEWLARPENETRFATEAAGWREASTRTSKIIAGIIEKVAQKTAGGLKWYTRLKGLFALRNSVVHYYPERTPLGTWPPKLEDYIKNGTIKPAAGTHDWTSRLLVVSVAEQALSIATEALRGFDNEVAPAP